MWFMDGETILFGMLFFVGFIGVVLFILIMTNNSAKKYKKKHPEAATVWITDRHINGVLTGVSIKKVDGQKAKAFGMMAAHGVYVLPGTRILSLEHCDNYRIMKKDKEYLSQNKTEMTVTLEEGKDYTLEFNENPGQYSIIEGKPKAK